MSRSAIVVGAGIIGLATARALAIRGYEVTVLERHEKAVGASVRNFGMIWPIGQPSGLLYQRAMLSRSIWEQICREAKMWFDPVGSLHVAYKKEERKVLEEFWEQSKNERNCTLLNTKQTIALAGSVVQEGLEGSLYSNEEMIVDPRKALALIPVYLKEKYNIRFLWNAGVTKIEHPTVWCGKKVFAADELYVCNGADFETLFPELFDALPITKCKLQMMRLEGLAERIGPALCGGLSLIHYKSFEAARSLDKLKDYYKNKYPQYLKWGIHVMVSQNKEGFLTVGDSHEYANTHDPFDKAFINELILDYLKTFASFKSNRVLETWNGIYAKLSNGKSEIVINPQQGVTIINGLGGNGMTLSFGLCEQIVSGNYTDTINKSTTDPIQY